MSDPLQDHTTPPPDLLPIGTAPKDGTFIIAYTKPALEDRWMGMANRPFAIKHMGRTTASGLDLGWSLFPGMGVSDNWFEGWMPITRAAATAQEAQPILMIYRNWRGEVAQRRIRPAGLPYWGTTKWHPEPGWLLPAIDAEKGEYRDFAMKDCDFTIARQAEPGVICNRCGWAGDEDGLVATLDAEDGEPCRACPDCGTDANLMDAHPPQPSETVAEAGLTVEQVQMAWTAERDRLTAENNRLEMQCFAQGKLISELQIELAAQGAKSSAGDMVSVEAAIRAVEIATLGAARTTQERCVRALRKLAEG